MGMPEPQYATADIDLLNKGLAARYAVDDVPPNMYLEMTSLESREEGSLATIYGSTPINVDDRNLVNFPLADTNIHTLSRLKSLNDSIGNAVSFRYAGAGQNLYRLQGDAHGQYAQVNNPALGTNQASPAGGGQTLSGKRFAAKTYRPTLNSNPFLFMADSSALLKDSGALAAPQNWGSLPPFIPPALSLLAGGVLNVTGGTAYDYRWTFFNQNTGYETNASQTLIPAKFASPVNQKIRVTISVNQTVYPVVDPQFTHVRLYRRGGSLPDAWRLVSQVTLTGALTDAKLAGNGASVANGAAQPWANPNNVTTEGGSYATVGINSVSGGPKFPTVVGQTFGGSGLLWTNPQGIKANDANPAVIQIGASQTSDFILGRGYGFAIPNTSAITGIQVTIRKRYVVAPGRAGRLQDQTVVLVKNNAHIGLSRAKNTAWPTTTQDIVYGSSNDLWGLPLTPADVNDPTFGATIAVSQTLATAGSLAYAAIDSISITVFFTAPTTATSQFLQCTQYGFTVPLGASLSGVQLQLTAFTTAPGANLTLVLLRNGVPFGNTKSIALSTIAKTYSLGGLSDLWGALLVATDVNQANFGVQVVATMNQGGAATVNVNAARMTIFGTGAGFGAPFSLTFDDNVPDVNIQASPLLQLDNQTPVVTPLRIPVGTSATSNTSASAAGTLTNMPVVDSSFLKAGQLVTVGVVGSSTLETVMNTADGVLTAFFQYAHAIGEPVTAGNSGPKAMPLMEVAFDRAWFAGDPDNPHILFYSKRFNPESVPPQNFIEVGEPGAPIMAVVAISGGLFVFTTKRVYEILAPGIIGASAYPNPTGVRHGLVANWAWAATESEIYYLSYDGLYVFRPHAGSAIYISESIEWLFTGKELGPMLPIDTKQFAAVNMEYADREIFISFQDISGIQKRIVYHTIYKRFRNDARPTSVMFFEEDTDTLLFANTDTSGLIYQDRFGDVDFSGYQDGTLTAVPMPFTLRTPQFDLGIKKAFKQFNEFTIELNTNGQDVNVTLLFDSGSTPVPLGTVNTSGRQQVQLNINLGLGQTSQNVGVLVTGLATSTISLHKMHIRSLPEAEFRKSADTYWMTHGTTEFTVHKQGMFEYFAPDVDGITVTCYIEGSSTQRFSFKLPQATQRTTVRVRFPAVKAKIWRFVATSNSDFRMYGNTKLEWKQLRGSKGYHEYNWAA